MMLPGFYAKLRACMASVLTGVFAALAVSQQTLVSRPFLVFLFVLGSAATIEQFIEYQLANQRVTQ